MNPFELITFYYQFISYKDAMNICIERNIIPEICIRITAWIYDYFIGKQNKYYITEDDSRKLLTEFSNEFIKEGKTAENILFRTLIEIKFGQGTFYTTQEFIDQEKRIGDLVLDLFYHDDDGDGDIIFNVTNEEKQKQCKKVDEHIKEYTKKQNKDSFAFEPEQLEAIRRGCSLGLNGGELFNITGPPGTGKSTIVNCIVNYKLEHGSCIAIMAPTGLAQKNLKNSCKYDPIYNKKIMFSTLHRALNFTFIKNKGMKGSGNRSDKESEINFVPDILIVDEASMIDLNLFHALLLACERFKSSLILIGDINQLPPIGPGIPFESIIKSDLFHITYLTNIKRQDGNLKKIIEKLNGPNGVHYNDFDTESSVFIEARTPDEIEKAVTEIYEKEKRKPICIHKISMVDCKECRSNVWEHVDIHTMCAQKEKGVFHLNPVIQKIKNSQGVELFVKKYENGHQHTFYEGDLVMRTENDYKDEKNVRVNGDVGTIHQTKIIKEKFGKRICEHVYTVKYLTIDSADDEESNLSVEDVRDSFVPFYASSVHKMQGLQKTTIVFIVSPDHYFCLTNENSKKLVYTAISRCKANFYIVGDKKLFVKSQQSKEEREYPTRFMKDFGKYI